MEKEETYEELEQKIEAIIAKMKEPGQDLTKNADLYLEGQKVLAKMEKLLAKLATLVEDEQKTADEL